MEEKAVTVKILDRDYQVSCTEEEKESLISTARYLDEQMRAIKNSGNVIGLERIAVMAALNIAHELLQESGSRSAGDNQLQRMTEKISQALGGQSKLTL